jgi:hypothetical protein
VRAIGLGRVVVACPADAHFDGAGFYDIVAGHYYGV